MTHQHFVTESTFRRVVAHLCLVPLGTCKVSLFVALSVTTIVTRPVSAEVGRLTSIDIQIDPTPLILKGFAPELGMAIDKHRVYATVIAYDVPRFLAEDKQFNERRLIGGIGYQYFFMGHAIGPFAGLGLTLVRSRFELVDTGNSRFAVTPKITVRLGWAIAPLLSVPALFFAPWVGPVFSVSPETFAIDGKTIERRAFGVIGAVQIGWRLGL
jgi:hypothetical protein